MNMKHIALAATLALGTATAAMAEGNTNTSTNAGAGANSGAAMNRSGAGVATGANTYSRSDAMTRFGQAGYSNITGLRLESDGTWRGTGMKDGRSQNIMLDVRGGVNAGVR